MISKKTITFSLILLIGAAFAFLLIPTEELFLPSHIPIIRRTPYLLSYDGKTRNAHWVYQKLTSDSLQGSVERTECDFLEDPLIPSHLRATKNDYKHSGFDRGHLCPAADAKDSFTSMHDTFYLSNISPQHPQLNRKLWLKLEKYVRALTKTYTTVEVVTGPLYLPHQGSDGNRYVTYRVIGENDIAVPTHFFKVIRCTSPKKITHMEAFIIPNNPLTHNPPLTTFATPLEKVEKAAGLTFTHHSNPSCDL